MARTKKVITSKKVKPLTARQKKLEAIDKQIGRIALTLAKVMDALEPMNEELKRLEKWKRSVKKVPKK